MFCLLKVLAFRSSGFGSIFPKRQLEDDDEIFCLVNIVLFFFLHSEGKKLRQKQTNPKSFVEVLSERAVKGRRFESS